MMQPRRHLVEHSLIQRVISRSEFFALGERLFQKRVT
jgi:hypothetical protein